MDEWQQELVKSSKDCINKLRARLKSCRCQLIPADTAQKNADFRFRIHTLHGTLTALNLFHQKISLMRLLFVLIFQKAPLLQFAQQRRTMPGKQNKEQSVHVSVLSQADCMDDDFAGAKEEEVTK